MNFVSPNKTWSKHEIVSDNLPVNDISFQQIPVWFITKYKIRTYKSQDTSKMYQQYNTSIHIIAR